MNPLEIPHLTRYVNDFSHIFSEDQKNTLHALFSEHEKKTTEQVVTVFIPHREGNELLDIGMKVFNENGIGQKNLNNGLLLIVSTEEKKLRIIVGKGLELKYTEMVCRDIVENQLRPLLNAGKYEEMVQAWFYYIEEKEGNGKEISGIQPLKNLNKYQGMLIAMVPLMPLGYISYFITTEIATFGIHTNGLLSMMLGIFGAYGAYTVIALLLFRNKKMLVGMMFIFFGGLTFGTYNSLREYDYANFSQTCISKKLCDQSDNILGKWNKFTDFNYQILEEDKRLHPEKYRSSSSSSNNSSSSSFGGGGGSSNGGGYGD